MVPLSPCRHATTHLNVSRGGNVVCYVTRLKQQCKCCHDNRALRTISEQRCMGVGRALKPTGMHSLVKLVCTASPLGAPVAGKAACRHVSCSAAIAHSPWRPCNAALDHSCPARGVLHIWSCVQLLMCSILYATKGCCQCHLC